MNGIEVAKEIRKIDKVSPYQKTLWFSRCVLVVLILLSLESFIIDAFFKPIDTYEIELMREIFANIWWITSAILLIQAFERFLWTPLERKTHLKVPNAARRFVAFIILLLASFGIIAFVYNQQLTSLLATSGVLAMILGLAIQINISNIFSGIALNVERPLRIGDWVKIGSYNDGKVVDIGWRSVTLELINGSCLTIPNSNASETNIINYSHPKKVIMNHFSVYMDGRHAPSDITPVLQDALSNNDMILKEPKPFARFEGYMEWATEYMVVYWIDDYAKRKGIKASVWKNVQEALTKSGVQPTIQRQDIRLLQDK